VRRKEFDGLLSQWVTNLAEVVASNSFPSTTTLYRCIELGAQGAAIRSGKRVESNYWPNHKLIQINNAVLTLSNEDRGILIMKRVENYSWVEIGKTFDVTRWAIMKRMNKIEDKIYTLLQ